MEDKFLNIREVNPKLWSNFEMATKDFSMLENNADHHGEGYSYRERYAEKLLDIKFPHNYMVFITLVYLKGISYEYQPMEKVLWEIPFRYKEYSCCFRVSKYGFDLTISNKDVEIAKELLKKLSSAIKIADRLCGPIIEETINEGKITLENQSAFIRRRYKYFRNTAEELFTRAEPRGKNKEPENPLEKFIRIRNAEGKYIQEGSFNAQAMLDAYFSLQEHLLVLVLPFCGFNKENENLSEFIGKDWTAKFNRVFKPSDNPAVMKHFDNLRLIKESYRNKSAHGEFEKNNGSLYAHFGMLGAIPVQMSQYDKEVDFSFTSITDINFEEICKVIDEFDKFLFTTEQWKRPITLISSGVDINYDDYSIDSYQKAIESDESLKEFIEHYFEVGDRFSNMDW